jgi:peroxiredoxin
MRMPRLLPLAALFMFSALPSWADEAPASGISLGDAAPLQDVKMKNVDGREIAIEDIRGKKGTLVVFSCNACPWAQAWESRLVAIGNEFSRRGIGVIVINANDPAVVAADGYEEMKARARKRAMRFPYVVDATSDVARAFGATRTPEAFLFAADGRLAYHGTVDDNARHPEQVQRRYLRDALEAVMAGKPVEVAETKALGCSIKFRATG